MSTSDFTIICPCCQAKIIVDRLTGAVLSHEEPPSGPAKSFEDAVNEDKKRKSEAEDRFQQAFLEHEHRDEILDKKFKEAVKKAEKDDKPAPHPFEFD